MVAIVFEFSRVYFRAGSNIFLHQSLCTYGEFFPLCLIGYERTFGYLAVDVFLKSQLVRKFSPSQLILQTDYSVHQFANSVF